MPKDADATDESLLMYGTYVRTFVLPKTIGDKPKKRLPVVRLKYNPDQPRDPAGTATGGQWTDAGAAPPKPTREPAAISSPAAAVVDTTRQTLRQTRVGSKEFIEIEQRLADKLGMTFTGSNDKGQNQFRVTDPEKFSAAVAEYNKLPDAWGGKILNTDIARELSPDYIADRTRSAQVHEPASEFIKQLYAQKLAEPLPSGTVPVVLFTAGGTGAGKSTGLEMSGTKDLVRTSHIIYDTNMNTFGSADAKVSQAIKAGHNVTILYVGRDPVDAFRGALGRAKSQEAKFGSGRTVPVTEHLRTHQGAHKVVSELEAKHGGSGKLGVVAINNNRGRGNATIEPLGSSVFKIGSIRDAEEEIYKILREERKSGRISQRTYEGFGGK